MNRGFDSKPKTMEREIDFSRLVHEYVAARDVQPLRDAQKAEPPVAA